MQCSRLLVWTTCLKPGLCCDLLNCIFNPVGSWSRLGSLVSKQKIVRSFSSREGTRRQKYSIRSYRATLSPQARTKFFSPITTWMYLYAGQILLQILQQVDSMDRLLWK